MQGAEKPMNLFTRLKRNAVIDTFIHLKGNERACLWVEPLWGIPYNLYMPFVSVYMAALGMSPLQIGWVSTLFFASQMFWALMSGILTDKLGRRLCTLVFDTLSWSVPALLWAGAQNAIWFYVAALFNGMWRITENSWNLLLIEEADQNKLVHLFTIAHVAGQIAGFVAPLAFFIVRAFGVVNAMRGLYTFTFLMMTLKFVLCYAFTHETTLGRKRMEEMRHVSIFSSLRSGGKVLLHMLRSRNVMLTVALLASYQAVQNVTGSFWPLLVTDKLGIAEENLSVFTTVKSLLMLGSYFLIVPRVEAIHPQKPLKTALLLLLAGQILMLVMPKGAYALVLVYVVLEATALAILTPLTSSLQMMSVNEEERARMLGWFYAMTMLVTAPFGAFAGWLSEMNRVLPFILTSVMVMVTMAVGMKLAADIEKAHA